MTRKNLYILFPIVLVCFSLFVLRYKFQNLFISKYLISERKKREKILENLTQIYQNFVLNVTKNFYYFKGYIQNIIDDFKRLEDVYSNSNYKAFIYKQNNITIYGILNSKVFTGVFLTNETKNKILFSFNLDEDKTKIKFLIYYFIFDNAYFLNYQNFEKTKNFILVKKGTYYFVSSGNRTVCLEIVNNTLKVLNCTSFEPILVRSENVYENMKYKFFKVFSQNQTKE